MAYTPRMERVIGLALVEAERRPINNNDYVSTEHMLLALAGEGEGVAARVLQNLGITKEMVENEVDAICGPPKRYCGSCRQEIKG